ncbi:MAG: HD domain-containing protein [Lachnospiraceae bacterium]|nr:HD domain-containing protein [Lachnospiraceae bacterium]
MERSQDRSNTAAGQNVSALLVCIAGIAVNLILNSIVVALGLPLYLDTVGTVAVSAVGGYLPGAIVGFVTNIIKNIQDPSSLYYGFLNVLIAVFAANFAKRGWFKKVTGIIGAILVFTLIGGGIGSLIPWYMDGLEFDSESLSSILYATGYFGPAASHVLASLITDLPDKVLTVFFTAAMLRIVPPRFYEYCRFNMWMQAPGSVRDADTEKGRKKTSRIMSLRSKVFIIWSLSLGTVAIVAGAISLRVYNKTLIKEQTQLAAGAAKIAANVIDGDRVDEYLKSAGKAEGYAETHNMLKDILFSMDDIAYLYVYKIEKNGCRVVFDIDTESTPADEIASVISFDEGLKDYIPQLLEGKEIDPVVTNDKYGHLITAYQPVYDSEGNTVCYVGADVDIQQLATYKRGFIVELISIFAGFFVLICSLVVWLTDYNIIYPIKSLTGNADVNSKDENMRGNYDDIVKELRGISIHTGDEIESLYNSLCQVTLSQAEQLRSIQRLSDSTMKMQDGLIITMADMVENRDSDTGAHIQKTAAYVKIIVEGLKKKGYYNEKINQKFMSDVVRSAPLHDVGKINISDEILNKPGKLTDEEYEIMKTHTTAGRRILEHVIETLEGDNYLKEARNMAAYHHERWDGKGYPEGLHGEVIPLSARIMSVADVFDALTSARVYKPAFPLEKALSIIEEGKGTQFDPKCVEVFMESLDEVKVVLRKYNQI